MESEKLALITRYQDIQFTQFNQFNQHRESSYLRAYKAPLHLSRTLYKSTLFMQNKPNLVRRRRIANERKLLLYKGL